MYLRNALSKSKSNGLFGKLSKKFSVLDRFTMNTMSFRMTKYDPTKELEVKSD